MRKNIIKIKTSLAVLAAITLCQTSTVAEAVVYSQQRYNNNQMEQLKGGTTWTKMGVPLDYQTSSTACTESGKQSFNTTTRRMQICDGVRQFNMNCGVSPSVCTNPEKGLQKYEETLGVMQYCNGMVWVYMGSVPGIPCCPEGYVPVPADPAAGTAQDFCVSKYHMKPVHNGTNTPANGKDLGNNNSYYPESRAADQPWGGIDFAFAKSACSGLGPNFHLITNAEFMTVAKSIENNPLNWSGNTVGAGHIPTGHSDGFCSAPGSPPGCDTSQDFLAASINDNDGCYGTGNSNCTDKLSNDYWQKRTLILANGEVIWDMDGNMNSWVDPGAILSYNMPTPAPSDVYQLNDTLGNDAANPGPTKAYPTFTPFLFPPTPNALTNKLAFLPANDYGTAYYDQLGFGIIRLETETNIGLFRGGKFDEPRLFHSAPSDPDTWMRHWQPDEYERRGGLYSVWVFDADSHISNVGFRCSYIPTN